MQTDISQPLRSHRRLVSYYFLISLILIAGGLITSGLVEIYFRYRESHENFAQLQREIANSAAFKIEHFVGNIIDTARAATKSHDIAEKGLTKDYNYELKRLLFAVPAITEATAYDRNGIMRARSSRLPIDLFRAKRDKSVREILRQAMTGNPHINQVYFFKDSEPYITLTLPMERYPGRVIGLLVAEINLQYVGDVISDINVGKAGHAYVVTRAGYLIAHPDMSLVLQRRDLSRLNQVKAAFSTAANGKRANVNVNESLRGAEVISASAFIPTLDWAVLVERPASESYDYIYASIFRTSGILLIGFGMALVASIVVARRVMGPLKVLREGAERIGRGDLKARLELGSGDEFETLADEFNRMAASLEEIHRDLERKIGDRTRELAIANQKLRETSQHKSQFLANVNHELRTPVSAIIGFARLLLRKTEGQIHETEREKLQKTLVTAERLLEVINGLLDFSKIEAGRMELSSEPCRVEDLIQTACATVEPMLNGRARLVREVQPGMPTLNTDAKKLQQILINLLGNAVKFTERGEVKIAASHNNGSLKLVVTDSGVGIEKEALPHVFEEFHQGDKANARKYGGTGLGLAIVRRLVDVLGGEISVNSDVGEGSTFTVTLPLDVKQGKNIDVKPGISAAGNHSIEAKT